MRRLLLILLVLVGLPTLAESYRSHDGTTLYYDVVGKGTPVVLLSGGPGFSPEYLRPIADKLGGSGHAFILFHQRGTGKSVIETYDSNALSFKNLVGDLESLREHLKQEKLTILGHSFGGILAMTYAREHPDRVAALALVDSGGPTLKAMAKFNANLEARFSDDEKARIKEWSDPARLKEQHKQAVLELTKAKTAAYFADRAKAHLLSDSLTEASFNDGVFWAILPQMMTLDLRSGLDKVKAPVLVIHGKQDPLESGDEVHETFPGSRYVVIENAGHFPWFEQPEAFYKTLGEFLSAECH
jgi:proline iminopeptidase